MLIEPPSQSCSVEPVARTIRPQAGPYTNEQRDLFDPLLSEKFETWKATEGGGKVMRIIYATAASYARRFERTGRRVSVKLIWEQVRDNVCYLRKRMKLEKVDGFALNNNFHALVARHIVAHRPQWDGLFELRERHTRE